MSLVFDSRKNLLKRHPSSGSANLTAPSTFSAWFTYITTYTITHNLGYVPMVRVYYEPFANGKVYPATGRRIASTGPGITFNNIICLWEVSSTTLTIYLESASTETGTIPTYWVIYMDSES